MLAGVIVGEQHHGSDVAGGFHKLQVVPRIVPAPGRIYLGSIARPAVNNAVVLVAGSSMLGMLRPAPLHVKIAQDQRNKLLVDVIAHRERR